MAKAKKGATAPQGQEQVQEQQSFGGHYQAWNVKVKPGGEYEKLNIDRQCVKISDEEAEVLNAGVLSGGNAYAIMYFKAEEGE